MSSTLSIDHPRPLVEPDRSIKYIPSLDGIRALAIIAVIGFHLLPNRLRGGFTGVDVFFVLSGYLITSVILNDLKNDRFSMREFYLRRVQRLLPNAVLMVFVTLVLLRMLLLPSMATSAAAHGIWALLNLSNFYIWRTLGGYWGDSAMSAPFLHTWSLAVEEQFYLVYPLCLVLLYRRKHLLNILILATLASFALCVYATQWHQAAAFYLLPTRAWELSIGAALSVMHFTSNGIRTAALLEKQWLGWSGLVLTIFGFLFIPNGQHFPGAIALIPAVGTFALIASVARNNKLLAKILSTRPFVGTGKASYSLYLWHWPMIAIGAAYAGMIGISDWIGRLAGASVGVLFGLLAYWFIETPFRKRGPGRRRRLYTIAAGFLIVFSFCIVLSRRTVQADPHRLFDKTAFYGLLYNVGNGATVSVEKTARYHDIYFAQEPHQPEIWRQGGIVHPWGNTPPKLAVIGSSHALMYGKVIDDICRQQRISVAFLSADATPVFPPIPVGPSFPAPDVAHQFDTERLRWIQKWHPRAIIVVDRWDEYDEADFDKKIRSLIAELSPYTEKIIIPTQPPVLNLNPDTNLREYGSWYDKRFSRMPRIFPDKNQGLRESSIEILQRIARQYPNIMVLRPDQYFYLPDGSVRYLNGRSFLYADNNHLSEAGAELTEPLFAEAIKTAEGNTDGH